jgi:RHS repeat-associated protein
VTAQLVQAITGDADLKALEIKARNVSNAYFENSIKFRGDAETAPSANTVEFNQQLSTPAPILNTGMQTNFTYDANGNMTSDGTNTYEWDAENRLIKITYPGTGNNSQFIYDGLDRCVKIVEQSGGSTTNTKQFVWCGDARCEERDLSGALTKQFFKGGQRNSSANYFYCKDFPGSNREMTDSSGNIQAQYGFDPYGRITKLQGSQSADFQFAGYYEHLPSGLKMTLFRSYNANLGRWLSRDPVGQMDSANFYSYVDNAPVLGKDSLGLYTDSKGKSCLGYACRAGYAIPDPGDSLSTTMGKLGFSCKKVSSYKKCCCPGGFMFYIMRSNLPNPWTDPWPSGDSYYNEYHSVLHTGVDGGSGWSEMPYAWHPDEQPPFPGVKLPPEPFPQPVSNPDEAGHPMGKHKYCCCPKKKK